MAVGGQLGPLLEEYTRRTRDVVAADGPWLRTKLQDVEASLGEPVRASFIGQFKAGKSSVVNSLLQREVASVDARPATAIVSHFRYGTPEDVILYLRDGTERPLGLDRFKELSDHNRAAPLLNLPLRSVDRAEVLLSSPRLKNLTLVDTPGLGSGNLDDDEATLRHLRQSDVVIWVLHAQHQVTSDDGRIIRDAAKRGLFRAALAVINRCDEKPPDERPEILRRVRKIVGDCFDDVYLYSAEVARRGATDPMDTAHLELNLHEVILRHVRTNAEALRVERALDRLAWVKEEHLLRVSSVRRDLVESIRLSSGPNRVVASRKLQSVAAFQQWLGASLPRDRGAERPWAARQSLKPKGS
jgi:hypothetical protein